MKVRKGSIKGKGNELEKCGRGSETKCVIRVKITRV